MSSLTLPKCITNIYDYAISDCKSLKDIFCNSIEPPIFYYQTSLTERSNEITAHVPAASLEKYKAAYIWSLFNIVALTEEELSGINEHTIDDSKISKIYTLDGKPLSEPKKGLNIIKMSNGQTKKVIVK